jgi:hypothetical protein
MNKIHFLNPQNLCGRAVLLGFTGAYIGSMVFAIIDTIQLFTHEGSHSTFWLEYYLVIFIGSLLLTVIPLIIGSYFLAKILTLEMEEKCEKRSNLKN